ncbi:hypothetical protein I180019D1_04870 [Alistipes sp. i18-0019-D1]
MLLTQSTNFDHEKSKHQSQGGGGISYVVPLIERIDVHVEKGFAASDDPENGGGGVTELTSYDDPYDNY